MFFKEIGECLNERYMFLGGTAEFHEKNAQHSNDDTSLVRHFGASTRVRGLQYINEHSHS